MYRRNSFWQLLPLLSLVAFAGCRNEGMEYLEQGEAQEQAGQWVEAVASYDAAVLHGKDDVPTTAELKSVELTKRMESADQAISEANDLAAQGDWAGAERTLGAVDSVYPPVQEARGELSSWKQSCQAAVKASRGLWDARNEMRKYCEYRGLFWALVESAADDHYKALEKSGAFPDVAAARAKGDPVYNAYADVAQSLLDIRSNRAACRGIKSVITEQMDAVLVAHGTGSSRVIQDAVGVALSTPLPEGVLMYEKGKAIPATLSVHFGSARDKAFAVAKACER